MPHRNSHTTPLHFHVNFFSPPPKKTRDIAILFLPSKAKLMRLFQAQHSQLKKGGGERKSAEGKKEDPYGP